MVKLGSMFHISAEGHLYTDSSLSRLDLRSFEPRLLPLSGVGADFDGRDPLDG